MKEINDFHVKKQEFCIVMAGADSEPVRPAGISDSRYVVDYNGKFRSRGQGRRFFYGVVRRALHNIRVADRQKG